MPAARAMSPMVVRSTPLAAKSARVACSIFSWVRAPREGEAAIFFYFVSERSLTLAPLALPGKRHLGDRIAAATKGRDLGLTPSEALYLAAARQRLPTHLRTRPENVTFLTY